MQETKHNTSFIIKLIALGISIFIVILIVALISIAASRSHKKTLNDDWGENVLMSDNLSYIIEEDYEKYTRSAISDALTSFFLPMYPKGTGLGFVSYNNKNNSYTIIDSSGTFHTLTIYEYDNSTEIKVQIDETEKTYTIESSNLELDN